MSFYESVTNVGYFFVASGGGYQTPFKKITQFCE